MVMERTLRWLLLGLSVGAAPLPAQDYVLGELAAGLGDGPALLRTDLVRIALDELAMEYAGEAAQARREMRSGGNRATLARWSRQVQALADEYARLAEDITDTTPLELTTGPDGSLYLHVDDRLVVVSIPRMNEQAAFEARVAARFCASNRCADFVDEPLPALPESRPRTRAATVWSFSQGAGPTCSSPDGLEFVYRDMDDLGKKRETCARVVGELDRLARAIRREIAAGTRVDWLALTVTATAEGDELVVLDDTGAVLHLALPTLVRRPELLKRVRPWLKAKVNGTPYTLVINHAETLMAPVGKPPVE